MCVLEFWKEASVFWAWGHRAWKLFIRHFSSSPSERSFTRQQGFDWREIERWVWWHPLWQQQLQIVFGWVINLVSPCRASIRIVHNKECLDAKLILAFRSLLHDFRRMCYSLVKEAQLFTVSAVPPSGISIYDKHINMMSCICVSVQGFNVCH